MLTEIPVYGNYHGYYLKRPFVHDPRIALLPSSLFKGAHVLDVGCNEGWVTCEIAQTFGAKKVIGVDIDDTLIQAAWRRRRTVWSMQAPSNPHSMVIESQQPEMSKKRKRIAPDMSTEVIRPDYFPMACEHEFGPLPIPPSANRGKNVFPHNVAFRTADWINCEIPEDSEFYDVVVAFSLSKWVHLNDGDEGLRRFFRRVHSVLNKGGTFVLEPQSWDSYAKARRMDEKLRENAKHLALRPHDFESVLAEIGFGPAQHFGYVGEKGFNRPVDLYMRM